MSDNDPRPDALRDAIARKKAELSALQAELAASARSPAMSVRDKLALFRSLFRGREDVYPQLWVSTRDGRKGYSPACANEWEPGLCEKPQVKCSDCLHRAFLPVTDAVLLEHIQGKVTLGVYPLLPGETCWFLAADFDKASWAEDVLAFARAGRAMDVPVAVERSRSGNGAHGWIFFAVPIPASLARKLGCALLTQAMAERHEVRLDSYDRLFPNQDTMPKGGFGNLIALPFQGRPREAGHTVFVDDGLVPFADQWGYLQSLGRLDRASVERLVQEAAARDELLATRADIDDDEDAKTPWTRPPSRRRAPSRVCGPLPPLVRAVLAQRLFVELAGLPSSLVSRLKRLATFQNPEFYKRQSLRLSTFQTPRVIACFEEHPGHLALPRGCLPDVQALFVDHGVALELEDARTSGPAFEAMFVGELTPPQADAAGALLASEVGILVAPPGSGKTVIATWLIAARERSTLVLVHREPLLEQWMARLAMFLCIDPKDVGHIGGGRRRPNGRLDVAMIQSLVRGAQVDDLVAQYGHVIVDECHHVPAVSFERVMAEVKARYVLGLTATLTRRDGHHPIAHLQLGPVRHRMSDSAKSPFIQTLVVRDTEFAPREPEPTYAAVAAAISQDERRNALIVADVMAALAEGRAPLVLTERRDHLEILAAWLADAAPERVVLHGGLSRTARRDALAGLAMLPEGTPRLVLATGRYIGEGFDDPRLDTLVLAMPIAWKGLLVQYTGRLHRLHPGKTEVRIYDYRDVRVPMLRQMYEKRRRGYRSLGYVEALPLFERLSAGAPGGHGAS